jgi:5-formyltetrahydrofolate cyclo-ligase
VTHNLKQDKKVLRAHYRSIRKGIGESRREEAALELPIYLSLKIKNFREILSFCSFQDEIDTGPLNQLLLQEGKLALPKIEGRDILPYHVTDLVNGVKDFGHGFLEPDPKICTLADSIDCVFLPGIVFDEQGGRIGYGKGHYDQFMALYPNLYYIAIGFREQLSLERLPIDPQDQPYKELCLV